MTAACPGRCMRPLLTIADVTRLLRISERSVWRLLKANELDGWRRTRYGIRIPVAAIEVWLDREHARPGTARQRPAAQKRRTR